MEQIKPILLWLLRNRFWIVCSLVAVASLATWYMAWQAIDKQRADQQTKIQGKHTAIKGVLGTTAQTDDPDTPIPTHPNEGTRKKMDQQIQLAAEAALTAWQVRYDQQKEVLKFADEIPEHIRTVLETHQPMELPLEQELMEQTFRGTYGEFIVARMPELARETINTTWQYDEKGDELDLSAGTLSAKKGEEVDATIPAKEDLVRWNKANQALWHSKVTEYSGYDGNTNANNYPSSEQMLSLQQDLWILEAMLKIVAKVNEGYVANDLAPIERLDHILVGKDAMAAPPASIFDVSIKTDLKSTDNRKGGRGGKRPPSAGGRGGGAAKAPRGGTAKYNPSESSSAFHGRYVDRDYRQLNKSEIVNVLTSNKLSNRSYLAVAKRIPVRVGVRMDERKINDFIAAASNSPFTFEIRQVRINRHVANAGVTRKSDRRGGGGSNEGPSRATGGGTMGTDEGPGGGGGSGDDAGEKDPPFLPEQRKNFDVRVEFNGIVKIYNPPDRSLFFPEVDDTNPMATPGPDPNTTASN